MSSIYDREYKELISRLKKARLAKGFTQKELSKKLGSSQSYISKIEQGQIRLDVIDLKRIAKILDLNAGKVLK